MNIERFIDAGIQKRLDEARRSKKNPLARTLGGLARFGFQASSFLNTAGQFATGNPKIIARHLIRKQAARIGGRKILSRM